VTDVRPLDLVRRGLARASVLLLVSSAAACSSNGPGEPPGFSTALAPATADGGADGGVDGGAVSPFRAVRGSGPGYAWAVGDDGTTATLRGYTWIPVVSGSTAPLGGLSMAGAAPLAVELGGPRVVTWVDGKWAGLGVDRDDRAAAATFALAPNDAWVAGNGIDHWDGQAWTQEVASGSTYTSLFGSFHTDVWAVGPGGMQHYNGHTWSAVAPPAEAGTLAAVWVSAPWDGWFVGAKGTVLHWNGGSLTSIVGVTTKDLTSLTGTSATDVWAGGQDGTLVHWDGSSWSTFTTPAGVGHTITGLWRALDAAVFLVDDTGAVTRFVP
jgi:hypothetical protein